MQPSPDYFRALDATQRFHATHKTFNGRFLIRYLDWLKPVIEEFGCRTLLDYGCGKGRQWREPIDDNGTMMTEYLGVVPTLYDPGLPQYSAEPQGKFDIVVCTQVLGSIPVVDLPWAVDRLYGFAEKAIFVGESTGRPVKKQVHAHMREKMPHEWSHERFKEVLQRPGAVPLFLKTWDRCEKLNAG